MAPRSPKQESPRASDQDKDEKKRVGKACDRCRLKKSKCDGQQPCNRCVSDDNTCLYGHRKKMTERVFPKGFTDQLLADYARLLKGYHLMYEHCIDPTKEWNYPKLERRGSNGQFLIHDIAMAFGHLEPPANDSDDEESCVGDPGKLLRKFEAREEHDRKVEENFHHRTPSPSVHDLPMPSPNPASMSRTSSFGSVNQGMQHPKLQLQINQTPQYLSFGRPIPTVNGDGPQHRFMPGGQLPPTPTDSPSKENSTFHFAATNQHSMNEMNLIHPTVQFCTIRPQMTPSLIQSNVMAWQSHAAGHDPFGRPPTPFNHHPVAPSATPMQVPMPMPLPMSATTGSETTFATALEEPMDATPSLGSQFEDDPDLWRNPALQTENDPDMGYTGNDPNFDL